MKKILRFSFILVFSVLLTLVLFACENKVTKTVKQYYQSEEFKHGLTDEVTLKTSFAEGYNIAYEVKDQVAKDYLTVQGNKLVIDNPTDLDFPDKKVGDLVPLVLNFTDTKSKKSGSVTLQVKVVAVPYAKLISDYYKDLLNVTSNEMELKTQLEYHAKKFDITYKIDETDNNSKKYLKIEEGKLKITRPTFLESPESEQVLAKIKFAANKIGGKLTFKITRQGKTLVEDAIIQLNQAVFNSLEELGSKPLNDTLALTTKLTILNNTEVTVAWTTENTDLFTIENDTDPSKNLAYISPKIRVEGDETLTTKLIAKYTIDGKEYSQDAVITNRKTSAYETFLALQGAIKGDETLVTLLKDRKKTYDVLLKDVVINHVTEKGAYFIDKEGSPIFAFGIVDKDGNIFGKPAGDIVGKKLTVLAGANQYYGTLQLQNVRKYCDLDNLEAHSYEIKYNEVKLADIVAQAQPKEGDFFLPRFVVVKTEENSALARSYKDTSEFGNSFTFVDLQDSAQSVEIDSDSPDRKDLLKIAPYLDQFKQIKGMVTTYHSNRKSWQFHYKTIDKLEKDLELTNYNAEKSKKIMDFLQEGLPLFTEKQVYDLTDTFSKLKNVAGVALVAAEGSIVTSATEVDTTSIYDDNELKTTKVDVNITYQTRSHKFTLLATCAPWNLMDLNFKLNKHEDKYTAFGVGLGIDNQVAYSNARHQLEISYKKKSQDIIPGITLNEATAKDIKLINLTLACYNKNTTDKDKLDFVIELVDAENNVFKTIKKTITKTDKEFTITTEQLTAGGKVCHNIRLLHSDSSKATFKDENSFVQISVKQIQIFTAK